jgi:hypothetical protein
MRTMAVKQSVARRNRVLSAVLGGTGLCAGSVILWIIYVSLLSH